VAEIFERFGKIMKITILSRKAGDRVPCFVSFAHHESSVQAIEKYHKADLRDVFQGFDCHDGEKFIVRFADSQKKLQKPRSGRSPNVKREPLPPNVDRELRGSEDNRIDDGQTNLYVYPLPRRGFSKRDLERMFEKYGSVLNSHILHRSLGKDGFPGFVDFETHRSCLDAIRRLNGVQVRDIFDEYEGNGESAFIVRFAAKDNSKNKSHIDSQVTNGASKKRGTERAEIKTKLYVCPLPRSITEREVEDVFSVFGEVNDVHILYRKTRGGSSKDGIPGFVGFVHAKDAESAVQEFHGAAASEIFESFRGADELVVRYADEKRSLNGRNNEPIMGSRIRRSPSPPHRRRKRRRGNSWSPERVTDHTHSELSYSGDRPRRYDRSDHHKDEAPVRKVRRAPVVEKRVVVSLDKHGLQIRRYELERKEYELLAELTNVRKEMIELEGAMAKGH